ncbi:kinase-like domain-containing protein [Syncephalastrum racemosum]|uniref:non-specific serine/threonine protein kinase n=1 Tax=Syncephalastrum racemosum TaxID=13706 RepID=A0A1X2HMC6_SYNRA|nr:kinase-like domain-containing protein [Syncephalastrum racemosum]
MSTVDKTHHRPQHSSAHESTSRREPSERRVGDYVILAKIGQGSFATVYKAQHKTTHHIVAVKSVLRSKLTKKLLENLDSEIEILQRIRHDHIVGLIECQRTDTHIHLIMEHCSMGDLSQYIKRRRTSKSHGLPEHVVRVFLKQLASALEFLREKNLVHRDIKPQNLLLIPPSTNDDDALPLLKVADFGFARFLADATLADTLCGSPLYMGPEILSYKPYDAKADLWSVGAVLYEMVTGRPPFRAQNHMELLKNIQQNNDRIRFPDEKSNDVPKVGSDLKDLIRKLLKKDPVERISFQEFFDHPAINTDHPQPLYSTSTPSTSSPTTDAPIKRPSSLPRVATDMYEPPPFAHRPPLDRKPPSSPARTHPATPPMGAAAQARSTNPNQALTRKPSDDLPTSLYSRTRAIKIDNNKDSQLSQWLDSHDNALVRRSIRRSDVTGDEDVLQDYVVLDRRIIETNQFADEVNASPRASHDRHYPQHRTSVGQVAIPRRGSHDLPNASPTSTGSTPPLAIRERKISTGSAGSALAKALTVASERLFGGQSPPKFTLPRTQQRTFMITSDGTHEEQQAMQTIERVACMAQVVANFGDTKFDLLNQRHEPVLAEETMVLHIKALALLELGLDTAKQYWSTLSDEGGAAPARLNDAVQWMRERFNDCLERASLAGNQFEREALAMGTGVCVEKLLYDRALEMSRAAAVHELVGEDMAGCEQDYQSAIYMLEAILEVDHEDNVVIEDDDYRIINKFIDSIRHRISVLRKKREMETRD